MIPSKHANILRYKLLRLLIYAVWARCAAVRLITTYLSLYLGHWVLLLHIRTILQDCLITGDRAERDLLLAEYGHFYRGRVSSHALPAHLTR